MNDPDSVRERFGTHIITARFCAFRPIPLRMTRLCVPIFVRRPDQARRDALRAVERGADLVELRLDALEILDDPEPEQWKLDGVIGDLSKFIGDLAVPMIITCRPAGEGGRTEADDERRLTLLAAVAHDVTSCYVDIEWSTLGRAGGWPFAFLKLTGQRAEPTRVILSAHDFETRPRNLISLFADMSQSRADVAKLVWRARSVRDCVEAFEMLRDAAMPTVALCMGEAGLPSRVLCKKFNAFLSFASLSDDEATADGQVSVEAMKRLYRWDDIGRETRVYGVVGCPVAHSLSPHVHNAAFDATGHDGVYVPFLVQPGYESFKAFMETYLAFEPLRLSGLSVTLPHKENALRYVAERGGDVEPLARRIGAANTISIEYVNGAVRLSASNTDAAAIVAVVRQGLGVEDLAGRRVAILGAGGTGRTATAALSEIGCEVTVFNRTAERAEALAESFENVRAASLDEAASAKCDVLINTTSVGLSPNVDETPLPDGLPRISPGGLVFDTIYNPVETRLMRQATTAGAKVVGGEAMFLQQAAGQFETWTRQSAPVEAMRVAFQDARGH